MAASPRGICLTDGRALRAEAHTNSSIRHRRARSVAAALLALAAVATNAQTTLVTWTLRDASRFASGETVGGSFSLDPGAIQAAPPGRAGIAAWTIVVTGGTNPLIPGITFSSTDSGCLVACARISNNPQGGINGLDFRTPLSAENTFHELALGVLAGPNGLIFPTSAELPLISAASHIPASTSIQFGLYLPAEESVRNITSSELTEGGAIVTAAVVPEAAAFQLLAAGLAVLAGMTRVRALRRSDRRR